MTFRSNALALGLAGALALSGPLAVPLAHAHDDDNGPQRTMTLNATGKVHTAPDKATVTIGVESNATTAADALAQNTRSMQAVVDLLRAEGLPERDIQTSQFSVEPQYIYDNENRGNPPELVGYRVTNKVTATVRDLANVGQLLDKAVSAGSNRIESIHFSVENPEPFEDQARRLAVAEVLARAELYAEAADIELGPIQSITEGGGYQPPQPYYRATLEAADAAAVPIAAGEQVIEVQVTITWEIRG